MQYKELYYLLALNEEHQISRAAKKMNINQSSFSLYLQRIEERNGTKLYNRSHQCLTPAGELYCSGAAKILSLHDKAMEAIKQLSAINSLEIAIDINLAICFQDFLSEMIMKFNRKYPDIVIHQHFLAENQIIDLLWHEKLDLAYCYLTDTMSVMEKYIAASEYLLLVSPQTEQSLEQSPDELFKTHEYIGMFRNSNVRTAIETALFNHGFSPNLTVESDSYELTHRLMDSGRYITVIPSTMAARFLNHKLYPLDSGFTAKSGFILHSNNSGLPHIMYLMELTRTYLRELNFQHDYKLFLRTEQNENQ